MQVSQYLIVDVQKSEVIATWSKKVGPCIVSIN